MIDQLQSKLPGGSAEKASKAELVALLERLDACSLELEQQQLALGVLQQRALSMLQDGAVPGAGEEAPILQEIAAMQDQCLK